MSREPIKFQEVADPQSLKWFGGIYSKLNELISTLKNVRIDLPKLYTVQGKVDVGNLSELSPAFKSLALGINNLQEGVIGAINSQRLEVPDSVTVKEPVKMVGMGDLLDGIEELKKGFNILIKATQESKGLDPNKPLAVEIVADLPRPTANPVTNVSINGLGGFVKTRSVTVTAALTPLPGEVLSNRRNVVIFNNGAQTMEIGGSTFAFGDGMPVPAGTYSPAIDAGPNMIVYGRVVSGSVDARVLESSDIATGR